MPDVRLPLSGDVLQTINPWNWYFDAIGNQVGLVNINLGYSTNPTLERQILEEVGSYGRQLGRMGDVLGVLLKHLKTEDLSEDEQQKIAVFKAQLAEIEKIKARA